MRFHTTSDYIALAFELGLLNRFIVEMGEIPVADLDDSQQQELNDDTREVIEAISTYIDFYDVPGTKELIISAIEQIGDLREVKETILNSLAKEALENMGLQNDAARSLPIELWHDPERLRSDIMSLMPSGVYATFPGIAQENLFEAGQLLADHKPTPAAAMLVTAVEAALRDFCQTLTGANASHIEWADWADMEQVADKEMGDSKKRMYTLAPLRDIRLNHRNDVAHGKRRYNMEEVQRLFHMCIEAMTRMKEFLSERNRPSGIA